MDVEQAVVAALKAHASLTALVGDRIYPTHIPKHEYPLPWVMYWVQNSEPIDQLDGEAGRLHTFAFDVLTDGYAQLKATEAEIEAALSAAIAAPVKACMWRGTTREQVQEGHRAEMMFLVQE